ncbi:MAG: hypothetical protein Fur0043_12790 [Anaerolineales bacterium]
MSQLSPWTPEENHIASQLEAAAQSIQPAPHFQAALEKQLETAFLARRQSKRPIWREAGLALGSAAALIALALLLNWMIRSLIVTPEPAVGETPMPGLPSEPAPAPTQPALTPEGLTYDWHGTSLVLQAELPAEPTSAYIYEYQPPASITLEEARAFAAQMGLNGLIYGNPGAYLIVDGDQRLSISAAGRFEYYPAYPRYPAWARLGNSPATLPVDAGEQIQQFLQTHGFTFDYAIHPSAVFGGYFVLPLTPDGHPICHEYFRCAGLLITLDEQGILSVEGSQLQYAPLNAEKTYDIISAEEALQIVLASNGQAGMIEGMSGPNSPVQTWYRAYPLDQTVIYAGWLSVVPSAEGSAPLAILDGYPVSGDLAVLQGYQGFVTAQGQFHEQDGGLIFVLESYQPRSGDVDGLQGTILQQPDGTVTLNTAEGEKLLLPDIPANLPLPLENAFVLGTRQGEIFNWKSIDLRSVQGGGGGGGGGLGFYKLNLTGTPVSFPTPEPRTFGGGGGGGGGGGDGGGSGNSESGTVYIVQQGDTLSKIADQFGVTVEALVQANGLHDPSTIFVGQSLVIPGASAPQKLEGVRGTMSITIYKQANGSQRVEYNLLNQDTPFPSLPLEGENLETLQAYQNKPVDVWGTIETNEAGQPVIKVDRYEIPFPDLQFQILRGRQQAVTLEDQQVTLFTTTEGMTYVQFSPDGSSVDGSTIGQSEDEVMIEALLVPGEAFGGYPAARIFTGSAVPQGGPTHELPITADEIPVYEEPQPGEFVPPTAVIEGVELVYFTPDPNRGQEPSDSDQRYIQPAWLFTGHYSTGEEFFIFVQALKQEFLLPEIAPYTQPG